MTLSMVAPAIVGNFVDNQKTTVHAATTLPECVTGNFPQSGTECTLKAGETECPSGFEKSSDGTTCKIKAGEKPLDESTVKIISFLIGLQNLMNRLIWPILMMIGGLMDNSLLFGNGMEERLREIWIPIRNIVNILFVIALVGIALYNVLGIGDENSNYSIKAILPKIIIGIIVVNFSFLGIKVFLDGINVLTTAIFALPNQVGAEIVLDPSNPSDQDTIRKTCRLREGLSTSKKINKEEFEKQRELDTLRKIAGSNEFKAFFEGKITKLTAQEINQLAGTNLDDAQFTSFKARYAESMKKVLCEAYVDEEDNVTKMRLTSQGELFLKRWNSKSAPLAMAIGLGKIVFYDEIDTRSLASLDKVVINAALSFILYLLYLASFVALFIVLLGRLVVMWLAIALSPILLLGIAVPAVKEKLGGFGEITNTFVQNAIAPLGIGLALSIGWIMLKALQGLNSLGGDQISFSAAQGIPVVGLTTLQDLLVGVGTIAVIWLGVFAAASKSIAAPVTEMIKGGLSRAGSWVGTLPFKHAPVFHIDLPNVKGAEKYTGSQVWDTVRALGTEEKNKRKLTDLVMKRKGVTTKDFSDTNVTTVDHVRDLIKRAGDQNMSAAELQTSARNLTERTKLFTKINSTDPELAKSITTMAEASSRKRKKAKKALLKVESIRTYRTTATPTTTATTATTAKATHDRQIELFKDGKLKFLYEINPAIEKLLPGTTPAALKDQIGPELYKKVLTAYGEDVEKLKLALPKKKKT